MSAILTVRLTKEEQGILAKRSKRAGMKKATFVTRHYMTFPARLTGGVRGRF